MSLRKNFILQGLILFLLLGCGSNQKAIKTYSQASPPKPQNSPEYLIKPGDQLDIKFFYNNELNDTLTVRPDGKISLQLIDDVQAAGQSPSQLDKLLTQIYAKELKEPSVTVIVRSFTGQKIFVGGEVNTQGLVDFTPGITPLRAIINAGGFKETAKPENTLVIRKGEDNRPFTIRVDLDKELYGKNAGDVFEIKPFDIIYVPKTFIAKANKFVEQYIQKLLLFRGFSVSFGYDLYQNY